MNEYYPDYTVHPGETLQEVLEDREMTIEQLEEKSGIHIAILKAILSGDANLTPLMAIKLERALDVSAMFWNRMQQSYDNFIKDNNNE